MRDGPFAGRSGTCAREGGSGSARRHEGDGDGDMGWFDSVDDGGRS